MPLSKCGAQIPARLERLLRFTKQVSLNFSPFFRNCDLFHMSGESDVLLVERRSNGVLVATLNRPSKYNAYSAELYGALMTLLASANEDASVKALVREPGSTLHPSFHVLILTHSVGPHREWSVL